VPVYSDIVYNSIEKEASKMRSFFGLAAGVLACASGTYGQYVAANETVLPNAPPTFGVVGNNNITGNGSAVGADGKYSKQSLSTMLLPYSTR